MSPLKTMNECYNSDGTQYQGCDTKATAFEIFMLISQLKNCYNLLPEIIQIIVIDTLIPPHFLNDLKTKFSKPIALLNFIHTSHDEWDHDLFSELIKNCLAQEGQSLCTMLDQDQDSILHLACSCDNDCPDCIKIIAQAAWDEIENLLFLVNRENYTALYLATERIYIKATSKLLSIARELNRMWELIQMPCNNNLTILYPVVRYYIPESIHYLMQLAPNDEAAWNLLSARQTRSGYTLLHALTMLGCSDEVEVVIQYAEKINRAHDLIFMKHMPNGKPYYGRTALQLAKEKAACCTSSTCGRKAIFLPIIKLLEAAEKRYQKKI